MSSLLLSLSSLLCCIAVVAEVVHVLGGCGGGRGGGGVFAAGWLFSIILGVIVCAVRLCSVA